MKSWVVKKWRPGQLTEGPETDQVGKVFWIARYLQCCNQGWRRGDYQRGRLGQWPQCPAIDQTEPQSEPAENWNVVIKVSLSKAFWKTCLHSVMSPSVMVVTRMVGFWFWMKKKNGQMWIAVMEEGAYERIWRPVEILVKPAQWKWQVRGGNPENVRTGMSSRVKAYVLLRNDEQRFPASILAKEDSS